MFSSFVRRLFPLCVVVAIGCVLTIPTTPAAAGLQTDPCYGVFGEDPGDPGIEPEPMIAGSVTDAATSSPIAGATMRLYQCSQGAGALADTTTTNSGGAYSFGDLDKAFYYVEAAMTGPLTDKAPALGTSNPPSPIAVGPGDPDVDFAFQ